MKNWKKICLSVDETTYERLKKMKAELKKPLSKIVDTTIDYYYILKENAGIDASELMAINRLINLLQIQPIKEPENDYQWQKFHQWLIIEMKNTLLEIATELNTNGITTSGYSEDCNQATQDTHDKK